LDMANKTGWYGQRGEKERRRLQVEHLGDKVTFAQSSSHENLPKALLRTRALNRRAPASVKKSRSSHNNRRG